MNDQTDIVKYPSILHHLKRISTETIDLPADVNERFKVWQKSALRILIDACWDTCYLDFHKALIAVVQEEAFQRLFARLYIIFNKAPDAVFPGVKIAEFEQTSIWLRSSAFLINEDGNELVFEMAAETEPQDIFDFSRSLKDNPRILNGLIIDPSNLMQFIFDNVDVDGYYQIYFPKVVALFAEAMRTLYFESSAMMEEINILSKHDRTQWAAGFTVLQGEDVKISWRKNELVLFYMKNKPQRAEKLKITDEDFEEKLQKALEEMAKSVYADLPASIGHLKQALISLNPMSEAFEREDTSPGE